MSKPRNKKSRPQRQSEPSTQLDFWIALFVAIVTLAVFFPATRNEFVAWDDYELLVNNPRYRGLGWEQLRWMFSTFYMGHYQPLSWVTFGLDYLLWGMDPFGYHLTSVLLHTANAVLFLLDVYPLRRLRYVPGTWWFGPSARPIWWEKVPFLVLAAAAAVIAPLAQHDAGAMASLRRHGLLPRLAQSSYGVVFYLWKTIWPTDLSGLYELPPNLNVLAWPFLLTGAVVVGITIGLFMLRHSWPAGLASWICYVIIVAPVLGIIQSGWQMVADRYSYLSCL